jgi:hypothetical protein
MPLTVTRRPSASGFMFFMLSGSMPFGGLYRWGTVKPKNRLFA